MVHTVNHMLIGNAGIGRKKPEEPPRPSSPTPNLPSRSRLSLPMPNIPQMPLGGSSSSSTGGRAPIEDRPEMEHSVKFVWTGKPMIEGVKRTGRILQKGLSLGAQGSLMAGDLALRGIETGMDAGQMVLDGVQGAINVADMVRGFTRSRQQGSIEYEDGDRALEDIPRSSNWMDEEYDPPAIQDAPRDASPEARELRDIIDVDDEPEVEGDFVDLT